MVAIMKNIHFARNSYRITRDIEVFMSELYGKKCNFFIWLRRQSYLDRHSGPKRMQ